MPMQQWGQMQMQPGQQQYNGQQPGMMGYPMQNGKSSVATYVLQS